MIKKGDRVKGFRFGVNDAGVIYVPRMNRYVGKWGKVCSVGTSGSIRDASFQIIFDIDDIIWTYPISEYLSIMREEKLKELGI
jgi:hypothetical protein